MNWDTFFEAVEHVTAQETRAFMEAGEPERYQLIDVRQPKEYEQAHIPGAILIPLSELVGRVGELNPEKPTIIYCRSGVRSKAAAQILIQQGIKHVFNMAGGFTNWQGAQSEGDEEAGLEYFAGRDFTSTFELAFEMEHGLKQFYLALAERAEQEDEKETLTYLAHLEDAHMAKLKSMYGQVSAASDLKIMEGGFNIDDMLDAFGGQLGNRKKTLQLGMKLEAQAFDLYSRMARKHKEDDTAAFFQDMAHDEQNHLLLIAGKLDTLLETK